MLSKILLAAALAATAHAVDTVVNPALDAQILTAPTKLSAFDLVKDQLLFDFTAQKYYSYSPGGVVNANAATFPAATGQGLTMAWLALGPCAMLPPHLHPRATNFVVAVEGETTTYMIQENGAKVVTETLTPGKMTIFPQGSIHSMQNNGCGNATLISALNSDDTGTSNIVNGLIQLPADIIAAALGGSVDEKTLAAISAAVPGVGTGASMGSAECRAKCKI